MAVITPERNATARLEIGTARRVAINDLEDDAKNRTLRSGWIEAREQRFDFGKWTPPIVRETEDGRFILIEGHHRVALARRVGLGRTEVICYVYPPIESDQRVGEMYVGINDKSDHTASQKFLGRLRAGDRHAVAANAAIVAAGFEGVSEFAKVGWVHTPTHFERIARKTPKRLRPVLETIVASYGRVPEAVNPNFVRALAMFHGAYDVDPREVGRKVVHKYPTWPLLRDAGESMRDSWNCELARGTAIQILDAYNVNRRSGALPSTVADKKFIR